MELGVTNNMTTWESWVEPEQPTLPQHLASSMDFSDIYFPSP